MKTTKDSHETQKEVVRAMDAERLHQLAAEISALYYANLCVNKTDGKEVDRWLRVKAGDAVALFRDFDDELDDAIQMVVWRAGLAMACGLEEIATQKVAAAN